MTVIKDFRHLTKKESLFNLPLETSLDKGKMYSRAKRGVSHAGRREDDQLGRDDWPLGRLGRPVPHRFHRGRPVRG